MDTKNEKIMIAVSGGVDSSVAALMLSDAGARCAGGTMRLFVPDGAAGADGCTDSERDARLACDKLKIPFYLFDMQKTFKETVIRYFIDSYTKGETPNPCVFCNKTIKFGSFLEKAEALGYGAIATGHYARVIKDKDRYLLYKGVDSSKDQSYVLWSLSQEILSRLVLPLGGLTKEEVREAARAASLENADKGESQDICFVPDGDYAAFIERECGRAFPEGDFVLEDKTPVGRHKGIVNYTVGQRRGLGLSLKAPLYVKAKDAKNNRVVLCPNEGLYSTSLTAAEVNWIACDTPAAPVRCTAKIRYRHKEAPCVVTAVGDGRAHVEFDEAQRAISPGQSVVFYDGDCVIGGGVIL